AVLVPAQHGARSPRQGGAGQRGYLFDAHAPTVTGNTDSPARTHSSAYPCSAIRGRRAADGRASLVRFMEGPAGRRARLVGAGRDGGEVISVVRDNDGDAVEAARYLQIPLGLVQAAITYYGAYRDEIDEWIDLNEQEAAEARAAWAAGQAAIGQ